MNNFFSHGILLTTLLSGIAMTACSQPETPQVTFKTTLGDFVVELYPKEAPITVKNFLAYANDGSYVGTIFHRVIPNFVVQGGGMNKEMKLIKTRKPIKNEATNGLKNEVGTIAMARMYTVHSATSQFFINVNDNAFLDHQGKNNERFGYCVFGKVIKGMETIDKIAQVETGDASYYQDVPKKPIIVKEVSVER